MFSYITQKNKKSRVNNFKNCVLNYPEKNKNIPTSKLSIIIQIINYITDYNYGAIFKLYPENKLKYQSIIDPKICVAI